MASDTPNLSDNLRQSLADARVRLAVANRADVIHDKLRSDLDAFGTELRQGTAKAPSPLEAIKIEALANVMVLARAHCEASNVCAMAGDAEESHHWAVDEGFLKSAFSLVASVQLPVRNGSDD